MKDNPHNKSILCPRCGYDLRGITKTWEETGACPLTGKCSECGLGFDWHHIFHIATHPWLFEHHWRHQYFRSLIRTTLATFRPAEFWRDVQLHDRVHLFPLVTVVLLLFFTYSLLLATGSIIFSLSVTNSMPFAPFGWSTDSVYGFIIGCLLEMPKMALLSLTAIHGVISWWITMLALFAVLTTTLREARVRFAHLWRIACYSLFAPLMALLLWAVLASLGNLVPESYQLFVIWIYPWRWNWNWLYDGYFGNAAPCGFVSLIFAIWWGIWWARADSCYLRLRHWPIVWLCQMIVSLLVTINVLYWMNRNGNDWIFAFVLVY